MDKRSGPCPGFFFSFHTMVWEIVIQISWEKLTNKTLIVLNFLHYFQVLAAIPKYLREKAKKTSINQNEFKNNDFYMTQLK